MIVAMAVAAIIGRQYYCRLQKNGHAKPGKRFHADADAEAAAAAIAFDVTHDFIRFPRDSRFSMYATLLCTRAMMEQWSRNIKAFYYYYRIPSIIEAEIFFFVRTVLYCTLLSLYQLLRRLYSTVHE